ncbi:ABC transporter permease [Streptomyces sp. NPDC090052]|uniref:ABC transporter permease n=1 Tax=unclassified Streptomyces TaxID=2593676 RepID=UPI0022514445|nr:ABC transporter permease [Streptomyces sp. NBC_01306]MCX4722943.1 ABC transporter permease [Streptomyces sp. NBC_01306]WSX45525.1 ABC transporter permease [Streptomyces sp. NBC_00963]WSX66425.1 ABC transporter permease [Streptomyces sp. NBC_00932]
MSTLTYAVHDSMTMLRRNVKHAIRYPSVGLGSAMTPILMLLLFVYAFGDSIGAGMGGGRDAYLNYLTPGIIIMGVAAGSMSTSIAVCTDMTEGIINRFRTMNITRSSFMTGHVIGSVVQTMLSAVLVVGVALAVGFRSGATPLEWLAAAGLLAAIAFAVTWLSTALGLISKTVESASNKPLLVQFLPFLGSAFVPAGSMSPGLRWFAEYQPFTPMTETLRGLLSGSEIGNDGWISLAWCAGIALVGYVWSRSLFNSSTKR